MTLNARKSSADRFLKIKTDYDRARFSRNQQDSEKFDSEASKLQPVNLSETSKDPATIYQRVAESLQSF